MVVWMDDRPLEVGKTYQVKHAASVVKGSCAEIQYRVAPTRCAAKTGSGWA